MKCFKVVVLSGFCLHLFTLTVQAETFTLEQAFKNCRTSYPSSFEAKKRLACFDSISLKALGVTTAAAEGPNQASGDNTSARAVKLQATQQLDADFKDVENEPAEKSSAPIWWLKPSQSPLF